jgi:hypothetical protein
VWPIAVDLDEVIQLVDVPVPDPGSAMHDLRDVGECFLAEAEQVLALGVALGPLAVDGRDTWRAMLGQGRALVATRLPLVLIAVPEAGVRFFVECHRRPRRSAD